MSKGEALEALLWFGGVRPKEIEAIYKVVQAAKDAVDYGGVRDVPRDYAQILVDRVEELRALEEEV